MAAIDFTVIITAFVGDLFWLDSMISRRLAIGVLLFMSGACALVYQVAWLREFRLVFGGSTAATGAVLAVFMGGLGIGNWLLGQRVDSTDRPLRWYAVLELVIAFSVAATPWLIDAARAAYAALGGRSALGLAGATGVRIGLAALVMLVPTIAMGGTFPAAARVVTASVDAARRWVGLVYGANTLGAVLGSLLSTFYLLEHLGTRRTVWCTCLLNLFIALTAALIARCGEATAHCAARREPAERLREETGRSKRDRRDSQIVTAQTAAGAPAWFAYVAAGATGFAFFLMELVWFRLLCPILGGTTFTFGLILSIALLGIGLGGALYAVTARYARPSLALFALTCGLEALALAAPYALGDGLAIAAARLQDDAAVTFAGLTVGWAQLASVCILPAALASGFQFPLLIALLGRGDERLGRQVGCAFACNTLGAMAGSLAGGFGLLPLLTAPGAWQVVVLLLFGLVILAIAIAARGPVSRAALAGCFAVALLAAVCLTASGPTAVWRHSGIGAGRAAIPQQAAALEDWKRSMRRRTVWEAEGVEASVALQEHDGYAFVINGKIDGNAVGDAGTQIMLGMLGALLHPAPQTALVVGMGTGETAGWLAQVPGMQEVAVVELEPQIDEVARRCAHLNHDVLNLPTVRRIYDDAREVLMTGSAHYDLVVSEPSNPYRAGIANLFTIEFYRGVERRLAAGGLFIQWLQAYDVDAETVKLVLAALRSVFPHVEIWQSKPEDLLLVCSRQAPEYHLPQLRERLARDPYRTAVRQAWRAVNLEGVLAQYVAGNRLVEQIATAGGLGRCNCDDRNLLEYGFARNLGRADSFPIAQLRERAVSLGDHRPPLALSAASWEEVEAQRMIAMATFDGQVRLPSEPSERLQQITTLQQLYWRGDTAALLAAWRRQDRAPLPPTELTIVCLAMAFEGDAELEDLAGQLAELWPLEAEAVRALHAARRQEFGRAAAALQQVMIGLRQDPWMFRHAAELMCDLAAQVAAADHRQALPLYNAIAEPFAARLLEDQRKIARVAIARSLNPVRTDLLVEALEALEPHTPWNQVFLQARLAAYKAVDHPLTSHAERELRVFLGR